MTALGEVDLPPDAEIADGVRSIEAFSSIPEATLETLISAAVIHEYADGETISAHGQFDGAEFFIVIAGGINAARVDGDSGSMIVERSRAGDQYGLAIAISGMNPADGAVLTADGETKIAALETSALKGAINQDAELARELLVYFARKAAERHIGLIAPEASARQRIHAALLDWAEVHKGQWRIAKMPKHRELAERARVDESQTAAAIAALIASGVARRDYPGLAITDIDELRRLAS